MLLTINPLHGPIEVRLHDFWRPWNDTLSLRVCTVHCRRSVRSTVPLPTPPKYMQMSHAPVTLTFLHQLTAVIPSMCNVLFEQLARIQLTIPSSLVPCVWSVGPIPHGNTGTVTRGNTAIVRVFGRPDPLTRHMLVTAPRVLPKGLLVNVLITALSTSLCQSFCSMATFSKVLVDGTSTTLFVVLNVMGATP